MRATPQILTASLSALLVLGVAHADEALRTIRWEEERNAGRLVHPALVVEGDALVIAHAPRATETIALATIESPGVTADRYAIVGRVRYDDVEGEAFLRMWSHFPDGGAYFSRLAGPAGPMRALRGSSGWRDFVLPFQLDPGGSRPGRLTLELVFEGQGRVMLSPLRLVEFPTGAPTGAWWTDRDGGWIGAWAGAVVGFFGALIGVLTSLGRARGFVLGCLTVMAVLGVASLVVGAVALLRGQPYAVWYPLLLVGGLDAGIALALKPQITKRFEDAELRRMSALDLPVD
jgi:hypothetical protein